MVYFLWVKNKANNITSNINIPTIIINKVLIHDWNENNINNKKILLSCNYDKGYPKQICVSVSCDYNYNKCDNIIYAGAYIIQV